MLLTTKAVYNYTWFLNNALSSSKANSRDSKVWSVHSARLTLTSTSKRDKGGKRKEKKKKKKSEERGWEFNVVCRFASRRPIKLNTKRKSIFIKNVLRCFKMILRPGTNSQLSSPFFFQSCPFIRARTEETFRKRMQWNTSKIPETKRTRLPTVSRQGSRRERGCVNKEKTFVARRWESGLGFFLQF